MTKKLLILIFFLGLALRFLFFPNNIYFGFDAARDAFTALDILHGHLKLLGPPTSYEGLFHGVLYDYILVPIYFISQGAPEGLAIFLRIANVLGIILIFYLARILFNQKIALVSAILLAFSFEQTQFSIYMGNPSLATLTVPLIYLGLALVIFLKKNWGLPLAAFALGISIQFEFALFYLILPFVLLLIVYRNEFKKIPLKELSLSLLVFLASISTFILAELKFNFRTIRTLLMQLNQNSDKSFAVTIKSYLETLSTIARLNFLGEIGYRWIFLLFILLIFIFLLIKFKNLRRQLIFLGIWFFSLFFAYILGGGRATGEQLYYTNIGVSQALIIFVSFLLIFLYNKYRTFFYLTLALLLFFNLQQIIKYNPKGTITAINVQQQMLLEDEKRVLDLIYQNASGDIFAAKALTLPLQINTTWSYLYEWYGKQKYGYVPIWGNNNALGYPGNLEVIDAQNSLPLKRYMVLEPATGLRAFDIENYLKTEDVFTTIAWEKKIGAFTIQKRIPK